jgi:glycosyltransferase involved in cell wall biosynthesis
VRRARPDAILVQGPYEAAAATLAGTGVPVIAELHGDWRTATRLYGSPLRRALAPVADAVGAWGVRRAAALRTRSPFTSGLVRTLGREPAEEFVAFMDLELFLDRPPAPLPGAPRILFVGVLERYKNVELLAAAWRRVAERVPGAHLHLVGDGSQRAVVEALVGPSATWSRRLTQEQVARALDDALALVLPSRSEGLPRVVVESFARGRPVVATRAGGIADAVEDGINGLLVDDEEGLVDALVRVLEDRALAERLAAGAAASVERWQATPGDYAARVEALVRPYTVSP